MNDAIMTTTRPRTLLSGMLRQPIQDAKGNQIGVLADVIVRLGPEGYPAVTGLVARVGSTAVFVPAVNIEALDDDRVVLDTAKLDLRPFERRDGEVLLKEAVLGHRLIDVDNARLVRAYDVAIDSIPGGWVAAALDVHARPWYSRRGHGAHAFRDWKSFEALIGHEPSAAARSRFKRLRGLRPAQIADLIEDASSRERDDLFEHLHTDPELEADVIEELDDNDQAQVLKARDTADIAAVLSRMHADDVVDAILDLPQERRQPVLDALPPTQRRDVLRLMTYQDKTAGGLMGVEYLALGEDVTVQEARSAVRAADAQQPQSLAVVYVVDDTGRLAGSVDLVALLRADPAALLRDVAEAEPVSLVPTDDIIEVVNVMADYNLLSVPVVDDTEHILGVITVDDALEEAIPEDWRQRERRTRSS
ncbi:MgtE intracellular region [Microbacterium laevaniformans OR221]|jgi:CBS domain-containing protein|nr:MgtE intracellular region [Microbacterium laevaniformans OR221]